MAQPAYLRYSQRVATERTGGRYDLQEMWIVTEIENTGGGDSDSKFSTWQNEALNADNLPALGDSNQDGGYICTSRTCRSLDDQGTAYVDVRYVEDPLTLPTEVHDFSMSKQKPVWRAVAADQDDVPDPNLDDLFDYDSADDCRNSAADRYNPPPAYEVPLGRIEVVTRMSLERYYGIDWDQYFFRWNETDFVVTQTDPDSDDNTQTKTYPAGRLMLKDRRAPLVKEPYFHKLVTCVFVEDPDLWGIRLPDMGPRCLKHLAPDGSGGVTLKPWTTHGNGRGPVTDALGRSFSGPAELDGEGNQQPPNSDGSMPSAIIWAWWPVDDDDELLSAEFDDLDLFTPERILNV